MLLHNIHQPHEIFIHILTIIIMNNDDLRKSSLSTCTTEHCLSDITITILTKPLTGKYPRFTYNVVKLSKSKVLTLGDNAVLNMRTLKWSKKYKTDIESCQGSMACMLRNHIVITYGGWTRSEYTDRLQYYYKGYCGEILQPKAHPLGRKDHTLVYDPISDTAYMIGGWNSLQWGNNINDDRMFKSLWALNRDWTWKRIDTLGYQPSLRRGHSCCVSEIPYHCLIIFGGVYGYNKFLSSLYILNIGKGIWEKPMTNGIAPSARAWHTANVIGEHMIVVGGMLQDGTASDEIYVLSLSHMCWINIKKNGNIPGLYSHFAIALESSYSLVILGGSNETYDHQYIISIDDEKLAKPSKAKANVKRCKSYSKYGTLIRHKRARSFHKAITDSEAYNLPPPYSPAPHTLPGWDLYAFDTEQDNIYINSMSRLICEPNAHRFPKGKGNFADSIKCLKQI